MLIMKGEARQPVFKRGGGGVASCCRLASIYAFIIPGDSLTFILISILSTVNHKVRTEKMSSENHGLFSGMFLLNIAY